VAERPVVNRAIKAILVLLCTALRLLGVSAIFAGLGSASAMLLSGLDLQLPPTVATVEETLIRSIRWRLPDNERAARRLFQGRPTANSSSGVLEVPGDSGSTVTMELPLSSTLSTAMLPSCWETTACEITRPMPKPLIC
jgi:hypothetical protein